MPLPLIVSCFSKIQIGFTFLVPADLGSPGQRAVKRVCCGGKVHFFYKKTPPPHFISCLRACVDVEIRSFGSYVCCVVFVLRRRRSAGFSQQRVAESLRRDGSVRAGVVLCRPRCRPTMGRRQAQQLPDDGRALHSNRQQSRRSRHETRKLRLPTNSGTFCSEPSAPKTLSQHRLHGLLTITITVSPDYIGFCFL